METDKNYSMKDKEFENFKRKIQEVRSQIFGQEPSLSKQQVAIFYNFEQREAFANGLKKLLRESDIKQKELANRAMVEERVVSTWVNGSALPSFDNLLALIKIFEDRGLKPMQALLPDLLERELESIRQAYAVEVAKLEAKETIETYKELEGFLDEAQQKYDDAKEKYLHLIKKISKLPAKYNNCKEDLLEYAIELENNNRFRCDKLIDDLQKTLDELY